MPDTTSLFIFELLRNTTTSCPRTRRGLSAYACNVRLTPWASAKTTFACIPFCRNCIRATSPKRWKTGRMSALTVFGGRPVSVIVVEGEEEEENTNRPATKQIGRAH